MSINACRGIQIQLLYKTAQLISKHGERSPSCYWGAATDHRSTDRPAQLQQLLYTCVQLGETVLCVKASFKVSVLHFSWLSLSFLPFLNKIRKGNSKTIIFCEQVPKSVQHSTVQLAYYENQNNRNTSRITESFHLLLGIWICLSEEKENQHVYWKAVIIFGGSVNAWSVPHFTVAPQKTD